MKTTSILDDENYQQAVTSVQHTLDQLRNCSADEQRKLQGEHAQLQEMLAKLTNGRVEIAVFGEISTGKSALINALIGQAVAKVDVQGGWTREVWKVPWQGAGYCVPGLADSQVVLVDTPGLNEVGGKQRAAEAGQAAQHADLILFVTDSDLNETEFAALDELSTIHKPMIIVLNKVDLYSPQQRQRLLDVLNNERLASLLPNANVVTTSADPREIEYVIENTDGSQSRQWRKPDPDVELLRVRILEVLQQDGKELLALNAAMYAADKSDRMAVIRVQLRDKRARQVIRSYAAIKAIAVGLNPVAVSDVLGGAVVDLTMVVTLAHIYGLEMSTMHARGLIASIVKAAGWVTLSEAATNILSSVLKGLTFGHATILTAVPQGAAAGYGSFIVGQATKYYFEHGASWGGEAPKAVVRRILRETDRSSVVAQLQDEIRSRLARNPHAKEADS